jgi:hypothetical protein
MRRAVVVSLFPALVLLLGFGGDPLEAAPPFNCNQVHIHPNSLPNGQVGMPYSAVIWLTPVSPALPLGLTLAPGPNANQVTISGFPAVAGTYTFTVTLGGTYVPGTICHVGQTYTITIAP